MNRWLITFDAWFTDDDREDWYKDNYQAWKDEWETLEKAGVHREMIAKVFNNIIKIMRAEYGD